MIQSGVLRIFRMAVRGVCSLSALPVCFVSLLVRPVLSVLSALSALSALSCSVLLCPLVHPPVCPFVRLFRLLSFCSICSVRSSNRPFVHSFGCSACCPSVLSALSARPSARLSVCPFVRLFRLLCLSAHSSPSALPALSLRSFVSVRFVRFVRSVRFGCLPRPSICPSRSGAAEFYSADFAKCFVFSLRDDFSVPDF